METWNLPGATALSACLLGSLGLGAVTWAALRIAGFRSERSHCMAITLVLGTYVLSVLAVAACVVEAAAPQWRTNDPALETPAWLLPLVTAPTATVTYWSVGLWLIGALALITLIVVNMLRLGRLRRDARVRAPGSIVGAPLLQAVERSRAAIVTVPGLGQPCAFGVSRPVIVLPEALLTTLPRRELNALVAHELAHIERRDPLLTLFLEVLRALLWFNPPVHALVSYYRSTVEFDCDRRAAQWVPAEDLARALGRLSTAAGPALSTAAASNSVALRMAALNPRTERTPPSWIRESCVMLCCGAAAVAAVRLSVNYFEYRARARYLASSSSFDLDAFTYDVCSTVSSSELHRNAHFGPPDGLHTFEFANGRLMMNGTALPAELRDTLEGIFDKHGVRRDENSIFRYHQADSEIGITDGPVPFGERIGDGYWLRRGSPR
ncbi:MAG: M56 family metallopeptidase [Myxococcota bacterium]